MFMAKMQIHGFSLRSLGVLLPWIFAVSGVVAQEEQPQRFRVMQESPWVVSPMSVASLSMRPVQAYWDPQEGNYFIDLIAFLEVMQMSVEIDGLIVRTIYRDTVHETDFRQGIVTRYTGETIQRSDSLEADGYVYAGGFDTDFFDAGEGFLLTPPNLQKIFPDGTLSYDQSKLLIRLSQELFAESESTFRARGSAPTLGLGPMLYGRHRRFLGGSQIGYRLNRIQRSGNDVNYSGFLNGRASALWGQVRSEGVITYTDDHDFRTSFGQLNYLIDLPRSSYVTQIGVGRTRVDQWPVRQNYDGMWMSNRPLSTRHQQREAEISGIAEPNALVSALVGGVVADRVQADGQGRYRLTIPAYYGTSRAELEIVPAGGGTPIRETRYLFITEDLVPENRLYWDLQGGRDRYDQTAYGHAQASYGISTSLTALGSYTLADTLQTATLGLVTNYAQSMMVSAEVSYPDFATRATLQMFRNQFQLQGEASFAAESGFTFYRQRLIGRVGWNSRRLSTFVYGSRFESFNGSESMQLDGSATLRLSRRTNLVVAAGPRSTKLDPDAPMDSRMHWRSSLTRYATVGAVRGRVGFQGYGGQYEDIDFAGGTIYASYRSVSFGARIGYDFPAEGMNASFSIRMNVPWASFSNHSSFEVDNPYNQQNVYGSVTLGRDLHFSRHPQVWSSAQLRPFIDRNRDGRKDPGEVHLDGLDINVVRARTESIESGGIQADFLAPSTLYQVVIDPRSLRGPELDLPTGTTFSFISDPGTVKHIDIPVHENTVVEGRIEDLPLSSPTLAVVVFYQGEEEVARSAVSQQGLFTVLLPPGPYRLEVHDLLGSEDLSSYTQSLNVQAVNTQQLEIR